MGILAGAGGISKDAFSAFYKWFGRLPGGLAMATVAACAAFGAVCGDNIATAATMVKAALPEMRKYGYSDQLSTGTIACGGNLGILIPPSTAFIVYGFVTQTAIGALFISGIIPGILLTALFVTQIYVQCKLNPGLAKMAPEITWKERFISTKGIVGIAIVFIIVMGGLLKGFFTPSEAGAVGAVARSAGKLDNKAGKLENDRPFLARSGQNIRHDNAPYLWGNHIQPFSDNNGNRPGICQCHRSSQFEPVRSNYDSIVNLCYTRHHYGYLGRSYHYAADILPHDNRDGFRPTAIRSIMCTCYHDWLYNSTCGRSGICGRWDAQKRRTPLHHFPRMHTISRYDDILPDIIGGFTPAKHLFTGYNDSFQIMLSVQETMI